MELFKSGRENLSFERFLQKDAIVKIVWMLIPVACWILDYSKGRFNNYKIFKNVFWHVLDQKNLYLPYPEKYGDTNHYGPSFSILIAPFAALPDIVGGLLWNILMGLVLYLGINRLQMKSQYKNLLLLLCSIELMNSIWSSQFNPCIAGLIILTFVFVEEEQDFIAPLWILIGAFVKLYSIVGLAFLLFSKNKLQFVAGCVVWAIVLFVLPMLFSSPSFITHSYVEWFNALVEKNASNIISLDISLMGFFRKSLSMQISSLWFYIIGIPLVLSPLLRFSQYKFNHFRILIMTSLLMFVVLFSSSSEHPTYIICVVGAFLWMILQENIFSTRNCLLIITIVLLTGLAPTDVFSIKVREFTNSYALKALPCIIVWFFLLKDLLFKDFCDTTYRSRFKTDSNGLQD